MRHNVQDKRPHGDTRGGVRGKSMQSPEEQEEDDDVSFVSLAQRSTSIPENERRSRREAKHKRCHENKGAVKGGDRCVLQL